jgi:hypothetical protein
LHERDLHLIVVNRELTTFRHVHPTLDADGTWSVDLPALDPGPTGPSPTSRSPSGHGSRSEPTSASKERTVPPNSRRPPQ